MTTKDFVKISKFMNLKRDAAEFIPILESDLHAFLFHASVSILKISAAKIHMDTRVKGGGDKAKYDMVQGRISRLLNDKPAIVATTIIEIKMFADGFSPQQCLRRFHSTMADIHRLDSLNCCHNRKIMFLYDDKNYLCGKYKKVIRKSYIINYRDTQAPSVRLVFSEKNGSKRKLTSQ